jgi:hypothetical protein
MTFAIMLKDQKIVNKRYPGCYCKPDSDHLYTVYTAEGNEIMSDHGYFEAWACARWFVEHEHDWRRADMGIVAHKRPTTLRLILSFAAATVVIAGIGLWIGTL